MLRSFVELATLAGTMAGAELASGVRVWQVLVGEDWQNVSEVIPGSSFRIGCYLPSRIILFPPLWNSKETVSMEA